MMSWHVGCDGSNSSAFASLEPYLRFVNRSDDCGVTETLTVTVHQNLSGFCPKSLMFITSKSTVAWRRVSPDRLSCPVQRSIRQARRIFRQDIPIPDVSRPALTAMSASTGADSTSEQSAGRPSAAGKARQLNHVVTDKARHSAANTASAGCGRTAVSTSLWEAPSRSCVFPAVLRKSPDSRYLHIYLEFKDDIMSQETFLSFSQRAKWLPQRFVLCWQRPKERSWERCLCVRQQRGPMI